MPRSKKYTLSSSEIFAQTAELCANCLYVKEPVNVYSYGPTFSIIDFLVSHNFIIPISPVRFMDLISSEKCWYEYFSEYKPHVTALPEEYYLILKKYQLLLNFIQTNFSDISIYFIRLPNEYEVYPQIVEQKFRPSTSNPFRKTDSIFEVGTGLVDQAFFMVVARTNSGEWIGFTSGPHGYYFGIEDVTLHKNSLLSNHCFTNHTFELKEKLINILKCFEIPFHYWNCWCRKKQFIVEMAISKESLIEILLRTTGYITIHKFRVNRFRKSDFKESLQKGEVDLEKLDRYKESLFKLRKLLNNNLRGIKEYRIGLFDWCHCFSIGQAKDDGWLGIYRFVQSV